MKISLVNKKAFSLIEVLISMAVLSLGLSALAILMMNGIREMGNSRNQIIATGLAEEGIEIVTNLKDKNPTTFKSGGEISGDYSVDVTSKYDTNFKTTTSALRNLYINSSGPYFYVMDSSKTKTNFSRKVSIVNSVSGQVTVAAYVTWDGSGNFPAICNTANKCVSVTSVLLDE